MTQKESQTIARPNSDFGPAASEDSPFCFIADLNPRMPTPSLPSSGKSLQSELELTAQQLPGYWPIRLPPPSFPALHE